jgi:hypothetical protein
LYQVAGRATGRYPIRTTQPQVTFTCKERKNSMTKFSSCKNISLALGCAMLMTLSARSHAGDANPFKASFHGFAEAPTPTNDPDVVQIIVPLQGTGTHLGQFDELLVHHLNTKTLAFTGYTEWTAANGDKLYTVFSGQLYPTDDPAVLTFKVTHTVTGGTGRFKGASGTFEGVNGRFNVVTGEDLGGYTGTISYRR